MQIDTFLARLENKARRTLARRMARKPLPLRSARPVVSFTFDDAPLSAFTRGRPVLEAHGARGTYFMSLGLLGSSTEVGRIASTDDLIDAAEGGHELACHTFDHLDAWHVPSDRYCASIEANALALQRIRPDTTFTSFAYPKSGPTLATKRAASRRFMCCRGGGQAANVGVADLALLKACFLDRRTAMNVAGAMRLIDYNADQRGWLIFATHDVSSDPSPFGISSEDFEAIVQYAARSGAELLAVTAACRVFSTAARLAG